MRRFHVTRRAQADLDQIADYSFRTWGESQTERYLDAFNTRFAWLAENPAIGRARDDVRPSYRSFRQGAHIIFYVVRADGDVLIIGVPHASMDFEAYFKDEA